MDWRSPTGHRGEWDYAAAAARRRSRRYTAIAATPSATVTTSMTFVQVVTGCAASKCSHVGAPSQTSPIAAMTEKTTATENKAPAHARPRAAAKIRTAMTGPTTTFGIQEVVLVRSSGKIPAIAAA